jgi:catechol 2,3-dioxygenase-like lactoylglutathione lyase family enzyme
MSSILQNHYVLAVHDARRSADFYVQMLGFRIVAEPPGWIFVAKDNCMIMLGECPDDMQPSELGCHSYFAYLRVADADSYYNDLKAKGAEVLSEIENKPWQMREFGLRTIDGHRITIGHSSRRRTLTRAALEEQIKTAFSTVPPPPVWCLSNSQEGDEPLQVEQAFRDKRDWRALSPEFLDSAPDGLASALSFFSDEAFRFYLPAYLLADLGGHLHQVDVLFHVTHGLDDASKGQPVNPLRYGSRTWFDSASHKFAIFDTAQAAAIAAFIEYKIESPDTADFERVTACQALDNFWIGRTIS